MLKWKINSAKVVIADAVGFDGVQKIEEYVRGLPRKVYDGVGNLEVSVNDMIECRLTLDGRKFDATEMLAGPKQRVDGNHKRTSLVEKASNDRTKKAVHMQIKNGTQTVNLLLDQAYAIEAPRAVGYGGVEITFKCLKSTYWEQGDSL